MYRRFWRSPLVVAAARRSPRRRRHGSAGPSIGAATSRSGTSFPVGPLLNWTFANIIIARALIAQAEAGLLDVEQVLIAAQNDLAASDAQLLDRGVSLFKALGGGWASDLKAAEIDDRFRPDGKQ